MPPRPFTAKLADKIEHNPKFTQYFFELVEPNKLEFQAGQYVSIQVSPDGHRRSYSICSSPEKDHGFELMVELGPFGIGVQFLKNLQFGQEMNCLGPMGMFTIVDQPSAAIEGAEAAEDVTTTASAETPIVLVATGSGIAPFRSMILDQLQVKKSKRQIMLHWGLREVVDMAWEDEFEELAEDFPNFRFHPVISHPTPDWPLCQGRVTDCLYVHGLLPEADYYLCGSAPMIEDVWKLLMSRGVSEAKLHREKFY